MTPLRPDQSLVAAMERIWHMRPTVIEIEYGTPPDEGSSWMPIKPFTRFDAAQELRDLRWRGAYIERRGRGQYYVEERTRA